MSRGPLDGTDGINTAQMVYRRGGRNLIGGISVASIPQTPPLRASLPIAADMELRVANARQEHLMVDGAAHWASKPKYFTNPRWTGSQSILNPEGFYHGWKMQNPEPHLRIDYLRS